MGEEGKEKNVTKLPRKANMKYSRGSICWGAGELEGARKNEKEFQISGVRDGGMWGPSRRINYINHEL